MRECVCGRPKHRLMFIPLLMYKIMTCQELQKHYAVPPAVVNVARPRYASQNITKVSCFLFSHCFTGRDLYLLVRGVEAADWVISLDSAKVDVNAALIVTRLVGLGEPDGPARLNVVVR